MGRGDNLTSDSNGSEKTKLAGGGTLSVELKLRGGDTFTSDSNRFVEIKWGRGGTLIHGAEIKRGRYFN